MDTNSEFIGGRAGINLGRKIRCGRDNIEFLNTCVLVSFRGNDLRLRFFTTPPDDKHWLQFKELRNNRLERKLRGGMCRVWIISLNSDGFNLCAGAAANVKRCGNFAFFAGKHFILLRLRRGAPAGGVNRFKMDWCFAHIFVFEMRYCLFVAKGRVQFNRSLFPLQFRASAFGQSN